MKNWNNRLFQKKQPLSGRKIGFSALLFVKHAVYVRDALATTSLIRMPKLSSATTTSPRATSFWFTYTSTFAWAGLQIALT